MTAYVITNKKDKEKYTKVLDSIQDARHWIINHLDLSKEWIIDVEYFDCKLLFKLFYSSNNQ